MPKSHRLLPIMLLLLVSSFLPGCGLSPEEIARSTAEAKTALASAWTRTPTHTATSTATPTSTSSATPSPTITLTSTNPPPTATFTPSPTPDFYTREERQAECPHGACFMIKGEFMNIPLDKRKPYCTSVGPSLYIHEVILPIPGSQPGDGDGGRWGPITWGDYFGWTRIAPNHWEKGPGIFPRKETLTFNPQGYIWKYTYKGVTCTNRITFRPGFPKGLDGKPLPTLTPLPTSTPPPTKDWRGVEIEIDELVSLIQTQVTGVTLTHQDTFESLHRGWESKGTKILTNGQVALVGKEYWASYFQKKGGIAPKNGFAFPFAFTVNSNFNAVVDGGEWNTPSFRQLGLFLVDRQPMVGVWEGTQFKHDRVVFSPESELVADQLYIFMLVRGEAGKYLFTIWDYQSGELLSTARAFLGENFSSPWYQVSMGANSGTLFLFAPYLEFSVDDF